MHYVLLVQSLYGVRHFVHEFLRRTLRHACFVVPLHILLEVALLTVLKYQVIVVLGALEVDQPYNIRVLDLTKDFNFLLDELHHWFFVLIETGDHLDCEPLGAALLAALEHPREGALPYRLL